MGSSALMESQAFEKLCEVRMPFLISRSMDTLRALFRESSQTQELLSILQDPSLKTTDSPTMNQFQFTLLHLPFQTWPLISEKEILLLRESLS